MPNILDIIIPIYNTPEEYLVRALNSVNRQKDVDFKEIGVIIIDDCSKKIKYKKSWFKQRFPKLQITYLVNDANVGPGISRQNGIDISEAKYITFLDSDDEFYGNEVFFKVINCFKMYDLDRLSSMVSEEIYSNGKYYYFKRDFMTLNSLHGLFVKREVLLKFGIRFDEKLRIHEDYYYIRIVNCCTDKSRAFLEEVTYVWKWNDRSLMRTNGEKFNHLEDEIYALLKANQFLKQKDVDFSFIVFDSIIELYILLASNVFEQDEYTQLKDKYIDIFIKEYNDNKDLMESKDMNFINQQINARYNALLRGVSWIKINTSYEDFIKNYIKK